MPKKTKRVKAWAIIQRGKLQQADEFASSECGCTFFATNALTIFETKEDAEMQASGFGEKIVPVEIIIKG